MTLYDQYNGCETTQVYQQIQALGQNAFSRTYFPDVDKVLKEIFHRVAYNLEVIYSELNHINYLFKTDFKYNFERPLHKPLPNTDRLLTQLDKAVKPFGFVPLSLKYFYQIVGGVNFGWDYDTNPNLLWKMADPIQVASLDALTEMVTDKYWRQEMQEYIDEGDLPFLELSTDVYHKDNISGGPAYSLTITKQPSIDSNLLNEPNNTTFINYLRICFENCGYPSIKRGDHNNDYKAYFMKVKPQLKQI